MRAVHLARERDRARAIAVELEQRLYLTRQRLVSLESAWRITSHMSASAWLYGCHADDVAEVRAAPGGPRCLSPNHSPSTPSAPAARTTSQSATRCWDWSRSRERTHR